MMMNSLLRQSYQTLASQQRYRLGAALSSSATWQRHVASAWQQQQQQPVAGFHASAVWRELPYHIVVGLPALSPTMESGSLAEWYVQEGDSFSAGDVLAKIETDKATIDFEAQDDGSVAKLLLQAGEANDIAVGTPIMITVEESEDIAAFKDYVHKADEAPPPAAEAEAPPAKEEEAPPPPPPPKEAAPEAPPVAATPPPPPPPASVAAPPAASPAFAIAWGSNASTASPMAKTLANQHSAYVEKYGTTGQRPLL